MERLETLDGVILAQKFRGWREGISFALLTPLGPTHSCRRCFNSRKLYRCGN